jgi:hypothetical protein
MDKIDSVEIVTENGEKKAKVTTTFTPKTKEELLTKEEIGLRKNFWQSRITDLQSQLDRVQADFNAGTLLANEKLTWLSDLENQIK